MAALAAFILGCWTMTPAHAVGGMTVDIVPTYLGVGLGSTTEWMGARERMVGLMPGGRYQLEDGRAMELYGGTVTANLLRSGTWEFGPMAAYRFGRKDVEDPVVRRLPEIGGGLETGVYGGYRHINVEGIPWRLRVGVSAVTAVAGDTSGSHVTPYASFWLPLSRTVFVGMGAGVTWSSGAFMRQRFGVDAAAAAASGLPSFTAGAGVRQIYAWPALIVQLNPQWYVGAGAFYQRLSGDAASSPIVSQRGKRDQWTYGIGVGRAWP